LTDKYSKKLLVLLGSIGRGISYLILYAAILIKSLWLFTGGAFFLGFSVGVFWQPYDALVAQKSYKTKRSYAFGRRAGLMGVGNLLGALISITIFTLVTYYLPGYLGLQYSPLILFFGTNVLAGIIFYRRVDENLQIDDIFKNGIVSNPEIPSIQESIPTPSVPSKKKYLTKPLFIAFLVFGFTALLSAVNQTIAEPFIQNFVRDFIIPGDKLRQIINADDVYVMLIYFPGPIIGQLASPLIGRFCDKIKIKWSVPVVAILGATFTLILINLQTGWSFALLLLVDIMFAIGGGLIFQNFLSRISKQHRGKIFGMLSWTSRIGAIIGPILGGLLWDLNYPTSARLPFIISIFVEVGLIVPFLISIKLLQPHLVEKVESLGD
jgi:MFS family permease